MNYNVIYKLAFALASLCALAFVYFQSNKVLSEKHSSHNIILIAIPKSASTYLRSALSEGLNYQLMKIQSKYDPTGIIHSGTWQDFFSHEKMLTKDHFRMPYIDYGKHLGPARLDINALKGHTNKLVVHIRDPREVLLSLVHYVNLLHEKAYVAPERPKEYYSWNLSQQIDWGIENLLPNITTWITDWVEFRDNPDFGNEFDVLITTYDEMLTDELGYYRKILSFYHIPEAQFKFHPPKKDSAVKFRNGDPGEWRAVFTDKQKQRVAEIVPDELLKRFNWKK